MMGWRPIHKPHVIERAKVICSFDAELRPKFSKRLAEIVEAKRGELGLGPQQEKSGKGLRIRLGANETPKPEETDLGGWVFPSLDAEGRIVEAVALERSIVSYETARYEGWEVFHQRFQTIAADVIKEISTFDDISAFALEYTDRFIFEDEDGGPASPEGLIEIAPDITLTDPIKQGHMWHLHRGWFEDGSKGQLLINQNLDAQEGMLDKKPTRSIAIVTKVEARSKFWELDAEDLAPHLHEMHESMKSVLAGALSNDALEMIGMEEYKS